MLKYLFFSNYFKSLGLTIKFIAIVIGRFFRILFRRRKKLKELKFEYSTKYLFKESYLVLEHQFKNALWYKFKGLKSTTSKQTAVFNLAKIKEPIILIVYGFFQKKSYEISVFPEKYIESKSFHISVQNIDEKINFIPSFKILIHQPSVYIPMIIHTKSKIVIHHSPYNQNDYI